MISITIGIALVGSFLIFFLPPVYSIIIYVAALAWYPSNLTIQVSSIDFSVARILILAIFLKIFLLSHLYRYYKFSWLDALIIFYFFCQMISGLITTPIAILLENRGGAVFDTVLPYFAARIILRSREDYILILKGLLCVSAPMALCAFHESLSGNNPFLFLQQYASWTGRTAVLSPRFGFYRAQTIFPHAIMLGLFFSMLGSVGCGLLKTQQKYMPFWVVGIGIMGLGLFSSMSSGSFLSAIIAVGFMIFFRYQRHWKLLVAAIIAACVLMEIVSNRHFYDVLGGMALDSRTAWYRSRLIDVALFEGGMSGHWVFGYGLFVDPGWGALLDWRSHTDMVNNYLKILCEFGLVGLIPFCIMIGFTFRELIRAYKKRIDTATKWFIWTLSATITGILVSLVSVSLFGQPMTLFFIILGFCGSFSFMVGRTAAKTELRRSQASSVQARRNALPVSRQQEADGVGAGYHAAG